MLQHHTLRIGKSECQLNIPEENVAGILMPREYPGVPDPVQAVRTALDCPTGTPPLLALLEHRRPRRVAIVVNDITRPTPYHAMLPPLLETLAAAGVTPEQICFVVATGIHRGHAPAENEQIFGREVAEKYRFVNHDSRGDLCRIGRLSDGTDLVINREVAEADFIILTGLIGLHYFAGFSGGRKSILPGVASHQLITENHARMVDPRADTGRYRDNPVHHIMMEAARMAGVDFILNVVTNSRKEMVKVVAGDLEAAWLEGVEVCEAMSMLPLAAEAEVTIACAGGFPKDIDVYQAQKAMEAAAPATRKGGTIILVAECREGYGGEAAFERWVKEADSPAAIIARFQREFELGGHKAFAIARVLVEKEVVLVSCLPRETVEGLFFRYAASLDEALEYVRQKHGPQFKALIMPQASLLFPVMGRSPEPAPQPQVAG